MDTILFFRHADPYAARLRLEGINALAREVGWNVQCYEERLDARTLKAIREFWNPIGTILSPNDGATEYDVSLFDPANTVLLDCFPATRFETFNIVITDSIRVTEMAVRELLSAHCASYGFVPWLHPRIWSDNRRFNFRKLLAREGLSPREFEASDENIDVRQFQQELIGWINSLPKPCGIFAANDRVGENIIRACQLAGISIPFDCRVVGVDDNAIVCENTHPTLSSVGLDFRQSGYRAARMLRDVVARQRVEQEFVSVPPLGFTRRNSSRVFLQTDRYALKASELIRTRACEGLQARDVLALFPCSRRLAEMRFRKATGRSVLDEIHTVRIERAKKLLRNPYQRLDAVAGLCGYASDTTFRRLFREQTGLTLRQWQLGREDRP